MIPACRIVLKFTFAPVATVEFNKFDKLKDVRLLGIGILELKLQIEIKNNLPILFNVLSSIQT